MVVRARYSELYGAAGPRAEALNPKDGDFL
jgi:hypothetical protein